MLLRASSVSAALGAARVTPDYFGTIGVPLALGRAFAADDHTSAARGIVAIISHAAWQTYVQGAADVVCRPILVNGRPTTIIGVVAEPFRGTYFAPLVDVWVPFVSFSRAIGNEEMEAEGAAHQLKGKAVEEAVKAGERMKGTAQAVKGHIEKGVGDAVDNDRLRAKGEWDKAVGKARKDFNDD